MRFAPALLLLFLACLAGACKKDRLHFTSVQKIASQSDTDRLNRVMFTDAKNGYIVGGKWYIEALVLTTHDGGTTWERHAFPNAGQLLFSVTKSADGSVYAAGFEGKLLRSTDTGKTWNFHQLEHYWFRDVALPTPDKAIVVGGISFGSGLIQHIDTLGGLQTRDSFSYQLNQIKMVTPQVGYICGFGVFMKTTDGGQSWVIEDVQGDNFMSMSILGDDIWLCGDNGSAFHSSDAGIHWQRLRNGNDISLPRYHLQDICFTDRQNGWAVGDDGVVLYSDDGGKHWMEFDRFTGSLLTSMAPQPDGSMMVVGDNGSIYRLMR